MSMSADMAPGIALRACLVGVACCAAWLAAAARVRAEDFVTLVARDGAGPSARIPCEIIDYTGSELRVRVAGGRVRVIAPADVAAIETTHSAEQQAGDALFAAGDFRLAEAKYRAAVETDREVRGWMRRQILAQIVWCQAATGKWDQAGETFLTLLAGDATTQYFDCIPLAWLAARTTTTLENKARAWLVDERPVAALLGASHLVATDQRPAAIARLKSLTRDADPRVAWLAQAQLWRVDAVRAAPSDLERWSQAVEASDESLRAGPYFVLGTALAARDPEGAALALLEVPLVYPRQRQLSAAALLLAGGCLEKLDRREQAAGLYRELIARFENAVEAGEAQRRLENL